MYDGIKLKEVKNGVATFESENEYEVKVTLTQAPFEYYEELEKLNLKLKSQSQSNEEIEEIENIKPQKGNNFGIVFSDSRFETYKKRENNWWWRLVDIKFTPSKYLPLLNNY